MDPQNLTSNLTNFTSGPPLPGSLDPWVLATAVLQSVCVLVGVPGNLSVIILKPNWQKLSLMTQSLMMNLAVSDLLSLLILPGWIYQAFYSWEMGEVACKILAFSEYCSIYSSILTVTALSIQRYMTVVHEHKCLQFQKRLLVLVWMISVTLSVPAVVVRQTFHDQQKCVSVYSSAQLVTVSLTECTVGFSSLSIIAFTYIGLNRKLKKEVFFSSSWTCKLVTSITVTCFVLWMPYCIFNLVAVALILFTNKRLHAWPYMMGSVTLINSCLNPFLYAFAFKICGQGNNNTSENNAETAMTNDGTA